MQTETTGRHPTSRDHVLRAASRMLAEDPGATLSVRVVAARAGVSTGSLRHHFPTQRALQDAVLADIYDRTTSDDPIHDRSRPARDRLVACLRQVLAPAQVGREARRALTTVFEAFISTEPTEEARRAYLGMEQQGRQRTEYWLSVLAQEGALADDDIARNARFLMTVLDGLSLERALPAEHSILTAETETLHMAVDQVLGPRAG